MLKLIIDRVEHTMRISIVASLFMLSLYFSIGISAQTIDGVYTWEQDSDVRVSVREGTFALIRQAPSLVGIDTLAICSVSKVRDYLFEINSKTVSPTTDKIVKYSKDSTLNGSARIEVVLPNYKLPLKVEIRPDRKSRFHLGDIYVGQWDRDYSYHERYEFNVEDGFGGIEIPCVNDTSVSYHSRKKIKVSKQVTEYMYNLHLMTLRNEDITYSFNREDMTYSRVFMFLDADYLIKPKDVITVSLPGIRPEDFERYYISGEYFRIRNDTLYWKGEQFRKVTKTEDTVF